MGLFEEIEKENKFILEKLINKKSNYIYKIAKKYKNVFEDYEDLIQEGIKTYIKMIYNFKKVYKLDYKRFNRSANVCIRRNMEKYVLKNLYRITDFEVEGYSICAHAYEKCRYYLKKEPSDIELAKYLGIRLDQANVILRILNNFEQEYFIDEDVYIDTKASFEEYVLNKLNTENFKKECLDEILTKKQNDVFSYRYGFYDGDCYEFNTIGNMNGATRQSAFDCHDNAIKRLKKYKTKEDLKKYL